MKRYARPSWNKTFPEGIPSKFLYPSSPVEPYPIPVPCRCHTPPVPCELSHQELCHGSPPSQTEAIPQSPSSAKSTFLPTVGNPPGYHLLLAVQEKPQIPVGSSPISFSDHALYRGTAIRHIPGEPSFVLTQPGVYQISYSATLSNADGVFQKPPTWACISPGNGSREVSWNKPSSTQSKRYVSAPPWRSLSPTPPPTYGYTTGEPGSPTTNARCLLIKSVNNFF